MTLDAREIVPMVTWGTSPEQALPITGTVPDPAQMPDAHKREAASGDLLVVGAYPRGQHPDICRAEAAAHDSALAAIALVPLPEADPVTGRADPLLKCWRG